MTRCAVASFPPPIPQNPYQRLLYAELAQLGIPLAPAGRLTVRRLLAQRKTVSVLHFHWLESCYRQRSHARTALAAAVFGVRLVAARLLGYRVVWTVHQIAPHETATPRVDRAVARVVATLANLLLVHDAETGDAVRAELRPRCPVRVVAHGSYVGVYRARRSRAELRYHLGFPADAFVFLAFGHVRAYKSLDMLVRAFAQVEGADTRLLITGLPHDPTLAGRLAEAAEADPRIRLLTGFVPDEDVADLYAAADAALVTRADGGSSGALVLALSLGVPVVAADAPQYRRLLDDGRAGWLFSPNDEASLAAAMGEAASAPALSGKAAAASDAAARLDWRRAAAELAALATPACKLDVLLVCSSGGHLLQLLGLREAWKGLDVAWATNDKSDARSLLAGETAFFLPGPFSRNLRSLVRNILAAWRIVRTHRPRVIVSTGADIVVPFAWIGRLFGSRVVYVESFTRIEEPSLSCKLVLPVADRLYVQWPELADTMRGARYLGTVVGSA